MKTLRIFRVLVLAGAGLAGCTSAPPPPKPASVAVQPRRVVPPDWFHRQLAQARHARSVHLPPGDKAGAQHAYFAVMLPACQRVGKSGPDKYRARCAALVEHATQAATAANDDFDCRDELDDREDSQAEKTACSD